MIPSHSADEIYRPRAAASVRSMTHAWPHEYVFLFAHMRSFSTALSHILGSHPEISGYTETHLKYRRSGDLVRLRWRVARAIGGVPRGRYLLDKLLHNFMLIPKPLRDSDRLRSLIFVRRPEATVQSILKMSVAHPERAWYASPQLVTEYYCARLAWLAAVGVHLKERALFFPAEALIEDTGPLLHRITNHLALDEPLQNRYHLNRFSGKAGHGDTSIDLQAGSILSTHATWSREATVAIRPEQLERCHHAYDSCFLTLSDWCPAYGLANEVASVAKRADPPVARREIRQRS
jgi:hypothetical protein